MTEAEAKGCLALVIIALYLAFYLAVAPLGLIFALNTLFGLALAYSIVNWFCAFILVVIINPPKLTVDK